VFPRASIARTGAPSATIGSGISNGRAMLAHFFAKLENVFNSNGNQSADASNTRLELSLRSNQDAIDPFHPGSVRR
jgi:hypothetical protein